MKEKEIYLSDSLAGIKGALLDLNDAIDFNCLDEILEARIRLHKTLDEFNCLAKACISPNFKQAQLKKTMNELRAEISKSLHTASLILRLSMKKVKIKLIKSPN